MPSVMTLSCIATAGAVALVATGFTLRHLMHQKLVSSKCYQDSLNLIKDNSVVKAELGEPIEDHITRERMKHFQGTDDNGFWRRIPITGPKSSGIMTYWVKQVDDDVLLNRVEVKFKHIEKKSLLVKKNEIT